MVPAVFLRYAFWLLSHFAGGRRLGIYVVLKRNVHAKETPTHSRRRFSNHDSYSDSRRSALPSPTVTAQGQAADALLDFEMITIILEETDSNELSSVSLPGNEQYLVRDEPVFPLLSQLSDCSYDVFSHLEMGNLIQELERIREVVSGTEKAHVEKIIAMAYRCRNDAKLTLTFTPCG